MSQSREKVIYSSQVYGDKDDGKIWIVGCQKELNETFATPLIVEQPVSKLAHWITTCERGDSSLGHPKIIYKLRQRNKGGEIWLLWPRFKQNHQ